MVKVRLTPLSSFSKRRLSEKRRMFFDEEACSRDIPFEKRQQLKSFVITAGIQGQLAYR